MGLKEMVVGGVVTLVIGGAAYTVNQSDVIDNFSKDTGVSQQEAEEYVNGIDESDLVSYGELGDSFIASGNESIEFANSMDCVNYEYEWESPTLSCDAGKTQLLKVGTDEVALGKSYKVLHSSSASKTDISNTIGLIDIVNADYDMEIIVKVLTASEVDESKKSNSYNKATLQAALQSNQ